MENKVNKMVEVPCTSENFYRLWLSFMIPFHKFTPQVIMIAGELLKHRQRLSKVISDERILSKVLLGAEVRNEILKACNCTLSTFRVTINKLKKAKFLVDGRIEPRFIPNIGDSKTFNVMLAFRLKDETE